MDKFIQQNLEGQYNFLLQQIENLDAAFLKKRHISTKWSIHEHLAHLGRYQEIFLARMSFILEKDAPALERYIADNDQGFFDWCQQETVAIITQTSKKRLEIVQFIKQLSTEQLKRIGVHPKLGEMTILDWTTFFLLHESHHLYAIFGLKNRFKIAED